jgi:hypothetical protein
MDVAVWLRKLGLEQYEASFRDNSVEADILPHRRRPEGTRNRKRRAQEKAGRRDFGVEIGDTSDSGSRNADFP